MYQKNLACGGKKKGKRLRVPSRKKKGKSHSFSLCEEVKNSAMEGRQFGEGVILFQCPWSTQGPGETGTGTSEIRQLHLFKNCVGRKSEIMYQMLTN
ncbi:hypothetical protein CEXT_188671 [Caerostris extrusa]|uniref:Uncharacterized protein n=1 Tax=Caerostris extrusa TaxID=172846 RepID=A0AAV4RDZ0_CAEEX|nr:hypothetical protein CEXT_188671 [Caerostris extrusa]